MKQIESEESKVNAGDHASAIALVKKTSLECRREYDQCFEDWNSYGDYKGRIEDPE